MPQIEVRRRRRGIRLSEAGTARLREAMQTRRLSPPELADLVEYANVPDFKNWLLGVGNLGRPNAHRVFQTLGLEMLDADWYFPQDEPYLPSPAEAGEIAEIEQRASPTLRLQRLPDWMTGTLRFAMGRESEIVRVAAGFDSSDGLSPLQCQAIVGMGGIGKTTLALLYADRRATTYDHRLFLNATSAATLEADYIALASEISAVDDDVQRAFSDYSRSPERRSVLVTHVLKWLERTPGWLLILDNADCYDTTAPSSQGQHRMTEDGLQKLLPKPSPRSHLLLTTRNTYFHPDIGVEILPELEGLMAEAAHAFLVNRAFGKTSSLDGISEKEQLAVVRIAEKLGYLPLALEIAASYVARTRSYVTYEAMLDASPTSQWEGKEEGRNHYHSSISKTWQINFDIVQQLHKASAELFILSCFFDSKAIPFELIINAATGPLPALSTIFNVPSDRETPIVLNAPLADQSQRILIPLRDYALVKVDTESRTFTIHGLVQRTQRESLGFTKQQEWVAKAIEILDHAFPNVSDHIANNTIDDKIWTKCERLIAHVQALTDWIGKSDRYEETASRLLNKAASYMAEQGYPGEPARFFRLALQSRHSASGEGRLTVVQSLNGLAALHFYEGRNSDAAPLFEESLQWRCDALPEGHPDIGEGMNDLALCYTSIGRYSEAEPLFNQALSIRRISSSKPDYVIAQILSNMAYLYRSQGRDSETEPLLMESVQIRRAALPKGHRIIASGLNNLGTFYYRQGRYSEAESLLRETLEINRQEVYQSANDLATGIALGYLANVLREQERYEEAESMYREALQMLTNRMGEDHFNTRIVADNLQCCLQRSGKTQ